MASVTCLLCHRFTRMWTKSPAKPLWELRTKKPSYGFVHSFFHQTYTSISLSFRSYNNTSRGTNRSRRRWYEPSVYSTTIANQDVFKFESAANRPSKHDAIPSQVLLPLGRLSHSFRIPNPFALEPQSTPPVTSADLHLAVMHTTRTRPPTHRCPSEYSPRSCRRHTAELQTRLSGYAASTWWWPTR